jgi:hypothetical protein
MNKELDNELDDELRPEYDFANMAGGVRGKYVDRYREGTNVVLLEPDVAAAFPNAEAVNEATAIKYCAASADSSRSIAPQTSHHPHNRDQHP